MYSKSLVLHNYIFGVELTDTVMLLTSSGSIYFLSNKKKIEFLKQLDGDENKNSAELTVKYLVRNKADSNDENYQTLLNQVESEDGEGGGTIKVGVFQREWAANAEAATANVSGWQKTLDGSDKVELVDASIGLGLVLAIKDDVELDLLKKSSVLGNKILKRGFVPKLEDVIEKEESVTHEALAEQIEEIFANPKKIKLNVQPDDVQSAYFPIVQSGGDYDLRVSAISNDKKMKFDVITVSIGSRYQNYCSNVARTFLVDPPKVVADTYETLIDVHEACLKVMKPGNTLKSAYAAAVKTLQKSGREDLIPCLPKNLGFAIGAYFREGSLTLSKKNSATFKPGMTFNLCVGFSGVKLGSSDKSNVNENSAVSFVFNRVAFIFNPNLCFAGFNYILFTCVSSFSTGQGS